jgi:hypothetical protein
MNGPTALDFGSTLFFEYFEMEDTVTVVVVYNKRYLLRRRA